MKIGMPILAELGTVKQHIDLCRELGLDFVELNMHYPCCMDDNIDWNLIHSCKDIFFTVHMNAVIEAGELDEQIRKMFMDYSIATMRTFIEKAGIRKFNFHLTRGGRTPLPHGSAYTFTLFRQEYMAALKRSFDELSAFARDTGAEICFENITAQPFLVDAFELLFTYPNLHATFDVGHDAKGDDALGKLFMHHPHKVRHMHLHDYNGTVDHRELGTGHLDIASLFTFCKKHDIDTVHRSSRCGRVAKVRPIHEKSCDVTHIMPQHVAVV